MDAKTCENCQFIGKSYTPGFYRCERICPDVLDDERKAFLEYDDASLMVRPDFGCAEFVAKRLADREEE